MLTKFNYNSLSNLPLLRKSVKPEMRSLFPLAFSRNITQDKVELSASPKFKTCEEAIDGLSSKLMESKDQREIQRFIENHTGKPFESILDSKKTIKKLLAKQITFDKTEAKDEVQHILDKMVNGRASLRVTVGNYFQWIEHKIASIKEQNSEIYSPSEEKYNKIAEKYDVKRNQIKKELEKLNQKRADLREEEHSISRNKKKLSQLKKELIQIENLIRKKRNILANIEDNKKEELSLVAKGFNNVNKESGLDLYLKLPNKQTWGDLSTQIGTIFENIAAKEVDRIIVPQIAQKIAQKEGISVEKAQSQLVQLKNVRFSGAVEIDHLIVRVKNPPNPNAKKMIVNKNIEVVGVVETKYEPDKMPYGYKRRIEDLEWLTNHKEKDISGNTFKEFLFENEKGEYFSFSPNSFKQFNVQEDKKEAYENIYFVTTDRQFCDLNERLMTKIDSPEKVDDLYSKKYPQPTSSELKGLLTQFDKYELWNNVVFTNNDYLGNSLFELIFYNRFKSSIDKVSLNEDFSKEFDPKVIKKMEEFCLSQSDEPAS
ncbi:MAG: hypothetical protein WCK67_07160 [bacterium]